MTQARGYKGKTVIDFEPAFGVAPGASTAFVLPFNSNLLTASRNQTSAATITGRRDPVEPYEGNLDVRGSLSIPVDARNFGLLLKVMFGAPSTATVAAKGMDAAAVQNLGSGKVGLPCAAHGLKAGATVLIAGTTNYDGYYTLAPETTADLLVITHAYTAETLAGTDTVRPAVRKTLGAAAATDEGGGLVGLPCAAHGLPIGAEIVVVGTTNYDATYTVKRGTTADKILVTATYTAETLDGTETATAYFHNHTFKVGDSMPSVLIERQFPDLPAYLRCGGCKIGSLSLDLGGDGELVASLDVTGATESKSATAYDASPASLALKRLGNFQLEISEGGSSLPGRCRSVSLKIDFGLDTDMYTIGSGGTRGDIPEGIMSVSGDLQALFTDSALLDKAMNSTTSSLVLLLSSGAHQLEIALNELKYSRSSPTIDGPKGVMEKLAYQAFYADHSAGSCVVARLRNEIKTYGE